VLILRPPRRTPGGTWSALALVLAIFAATALLPESWFGIPHWRQLLTETFEVSLPATRSPQPWLTLEGAGYLWSGLVFGLALLAHGWDHETRHRAAKTYALGMFLLAALALGSLLLKFPIPWWPKPLNSGIEFGFFPNRNQTANVLALAGIMTASLGFDSLSRRHNAGYGWFAGLALIAVALVVALSRAGIAIFFCGTTVWVVMALRFSRSKKGATLGLAAVLVLLTGFFLFGGETLKRFQRGPGVPVSDYRVEIQRDALRLAAERPWLGTGLGNFQPLYALIRTDQAKQNEVLHPESDWLWGAVELGWPAMALIVAAFVLWFGETLPFAAKTDRHVRSAAAVCGVAFAVHGIVDVSAHRAGALWPALLLFSLARHPQRNGPERAWVAPAFRVCGLLMAALGAWWLASALWPAKTQRFPTSATLAWLGARADRENAAADYTALLKTADEALRIAPLAWDFYYRRAVAHAGTPDQLQEAAADFDIARFLQPRAAEICFKEGLVWLALDQPQQTIEAWVEALRRAGPEGPSYYSRMISSGWSRLSVRAGLAQVAETNATYLLEYLDRATGLEFAQAAHRFLDRDPTLAKLSQPQRQRFFAAWFRNGDRTEFIQMAVAHPDWQEDSWPGLAEHYARKGDFERAWRFIERYAPTPALPHISPAQSLAELERGFRLHPDDFQLGLALYFALRQLRQNDEALTTLKAVEAIPGRPDYVPFLEALLRAEIGDWEHDWDAWQKFRAAKRIE
jgi:O-antigen ligase